MTPSLSLHSPFLRWTTPIVWDRRHIRDGSHFQTNALEGADSRFTPWAWPFDKDIHLTNTVVQRLLSRILSGDLGCIGCALTRTLEPR